MVSRPRAASSPLQAFLLLCFWLLFASLPQTVVAEEFRYFGQLAEVTRGGGEPTEVKSFEVRCWSEPAGDAAFYLTTEQAPSLPWIEQYGRASVADPLFHRNGVAIGYKHEERHYALPVGLPFFNDFDRLDHEAAWERDGVQYEVMDQRVIDGTPCWRVRVRSGPARAHTLAVRQDRPLIVEGSQTVFMGQGDRFRLTFKLLEVTSPGEPQPAIAATTRGLL
jgi:hypothetical protein